MQSHGHRFSSHLGPSVGDCHSVLLMQAQKNLRPLIAEVVDKTVV